VVEVSSNGMGEYRVHAGGAPLVLSDATEALARARALAVELAEQRARAFGVADPAVDLNVDRIDLPGVTGDSGLVAATVVAECFGAADPLASAGA